MQPHNNKWLRFYPALLLLLCGCLVQPGGPDDATVDFDPQVRQAIAGSLQGASREDCLTVYGEYAAVARYVQSDQCDAANAGQLYKQLKTVVGMSDWTAGKYPKFSDAVADACDPLLGNASATVLDRRSEIARLFMGIALGAKDAGN